MKTFDFDNNFLNIFIVIDINFLAAWMATLIKLRFIFLNKNKNISIIFPLSINVFKPRL